MRMLLACLLFVTTTQTVYAQSYLCKSDFSVDIWPKDKEVDSYIPDEQIILTFDDKTIEMKYLIERRLPEIFPILWDDSGIFQAEYDGRIINFDSRNNILVKLSPGAQLTGIEYYRCE